MLPAATWKNGELGGVTHKDSVGDQDTCQARMIASRQL